MTSLVFSVSAMMKYLYILLLAIPLLTGCFGYCLEYDCVIDEVEDSAPLFWGRDVVKLPFSYVFVQTKFEPAEHFRSFRYRAFVDGEQYSYAETPTYIAHSESKQYFDVVVPSNLSSNSRQVRIEVSLSEDYEGGDWAEWRSVYTGIQEAAPAGTQIMPPSENSRICFIIDGNEMYLDAADNESVLCLKQLLSEADLLLEMYIANNGISSAKCDDIERIKTAVPLNHVSFKKIIKGDVYMNDNGLLSIDNETVKRGVNGRSTYIGRISESSLKLLDECCYSAKYFGPDTYPMTVTLK